MQIKKDTRVWVMPTDTIIGIHARAFDKEAIGRILKIKKRDKYKSFIILVPSINSLKKFDIKINKRLREFLQKVWPGPVTVGIGDLGFRIPDNKELLDFLEKTGPIVSTSANLSGKEPARSVKEAKKLFGDKVDEYIEGKAKSKSPSLVVKVLRK